MWVSIDTIDSLFLSGMATPEVGVGDEKNLLFGIAMEARQKLGWMVPLALFPCFETSAQSSSISDILPQSQSTIDVQRLVVGTRHGELVVLVNETLGFLFERFNGLVVPPVREVPILINS